MKAIKKKSVILLVLILLSGCFPVYKLQPTADFTIVDENRRPISGAEITIISENLLVTDAYIPEMTETSRATKVTDELGQVHFDSIHGIQIERLRIDGKRAYFWDWCIRKSGYETIQTDNINSRTIDFSPEQTIVLHKGNSQNCRASPK